MSCSVCGIERSYLTQHLCFHRLPKNADIRKKWLDVLQKGDVKRLLVCSNHFRPEDYRQFSVKPLLKPDAVPRRELVELFLRGKPTKKSQHAALVEAFNWDTVADEHNYYCMDKPKAKGSVPVYVNEVEIAHEKSGVAEEHVQYEEFNPGSPDYDGFDPESPDDCKESIDVNDAKKTPLETNDNSIEFVDVNSCKIDPDVERETSEQDDNSDYEELLKNLYGNQVLRDASNVTCSETIADAFLKRKSNSEPERTISAQRRCIGKNKVFRRDDFANDASWHRFLNYYESRRKEISSLKQKNDRLNNKVTMYKNMVEHMMKKNRCNVDV
ncbi:uncharacterized protein [Fopius arisanus]|uniref:THAP-type domain-containing protein n=1 Tax=Fopius arisanus TaxID=64838 RepID=A0A9R1TUF0_9HYME|nr:PREDICTED: uncharacterized protein LOC105262915 [Fopius arisanus]